MRRLRRRTAGSLREGSARYGKARSTVSSQGQITIPKPLRERYGLTAGAEVDFDAREGGVLLHRRNPSRHPVWGAIGSLKEKWRWPRGIPHTVDAYIDHVRGGSYKELTRRHSGRRRVK